MKRLPLIFVAAWLAGCATGNDFVWVKPGATDQQFNMDQGQCQSQAFSVPGGSSTRIALVYVTCMRGKGWEQQDVKR